MGKLKKTTRGGKNVYRRGVTTTEQRRESLWQLFLVRKMFVGSKQHLGRLCSFSDCTE